MKTYTTVDGDMWDSITHAQLGDVRHTDKLMDANLQYLSYFVFPAGIVLTLPQVDNTTRDIMPPWKQVRT